MIISVPNVRIRRPRSGAYIHGLWITQSPEALSNQAPRPQFSCGRDVSPFGKSSHCESSHYQKHTQSSGQRDTPIEISSRLPHIKVHPQPFPSLIKLVKLPGSSQFNRVRPNGAHNYDLMLVQRYCQAIQK